MFLRAKSGDYEELERLLPPKVDFVSPRRLTQLTPAAYRNHTPGAISFGRKHLGRRISTDEEDASYSEDNNFATWDTQDEFDDSRTSYSASDIGTKIAKKKKNGNNK